MRGQVRRRAVRGGAWTWVAALLVACGARTPVTVERGGEPEDAAVDVAVPVDAGPDAPRDGGRDARPDAPRDGGRDARPDAPRDGGRDARPDVPPPGPLCVADTDCSGRRVCRLDVTSPDTDLVDAILFCGRRLARGRGPGASCLRESDCDRGLCLVADRCAVACASDADCPAGQWCAEVLVRRGRRALQRASACVDDVNLPPGVGYERRRLADPLEPAPAPGAPLDLPPRSGTALHVLWAPRATAGEEAILWRLEDLADGQVLFDLDAIISDPLGAPAPVNGVSPVFSVPAPLTLLVPNGPSGGSSPAGYLLWIEASVPLELERTVAWRAGPGSVLDLDVFYVGGGSLHPAGGDRAHPRVAEVLREMNTILRRAGLRIGEVRHHDVPGGTRLEYEFLDGVDGEVDAPRLYEMLRLSAGVGRPSVSLFLVRSLGVAIGVAPGIPGPLGHHGRAASGVAIAWDAIEETGSVAATTILHELGHFLGLFHPNEQDGTVLEPIPDTPECRADRDLNGDGYVDADECLEQGGRNVMFWMAADFPQEELTEGQGRVLRSAVVAR